MAPPFLIYFCLSVIREYVFLCQFKGGGGVAVDNCRSLVTQCLISSGLDACASLNCLVGVAANVGQCPRNSPYRTRVHKL